MGVFACCKVERSDSIRLCSLKDNANFSKHSKCYLKEVEKSNPSRNSTGSFKENINSSRHSKGSLKEKGSSCGQEYDDQEASAIFMRSVSMKSGSAKQMKPTKEMNSGNIKVAAEVFTFQQLANITENFNPDLLLGEGGFGRVYRGYIGSSNEHVAVKQLDQNGLQGNKEFFAEVSTLSLVNHKNLVNLIGYCADGCQRILVYEFMPNGSLEDHLLDLPSDKTPLDWKTRMRIAKGAAEGLEYLHVTAYPPIIFRDFKSSNILLDKDFNPKLSDFGLAKVGPTGDKEHVSTAVMGTFGYCAPDYAMTGQLTTKSDIYSFGVVLLEIISGRRIIDDTKPKEEQNLIHWATPLFKDKEKFTLLADPKLEGNYPIKGLFQAITIAAMCIQQEASSRPRISDLVSALKFLSQ